MLAKNKGIM